MIHGKSHHISKKKRGNVYHTEFKQKKIISIILKKLFGVCYSIYRLIFIFFCQNLYKMFGNYFIQFNQEEIKTLEMRQFNKNKNISFWTEKKWQKDKCDTRQYFFINKKEYLFIINFLILFIQHLFFIEIIYEQYL